MSYILRSTMRYSVRRLSINCVKQTHGVLISQTSPHIRKLLSHSFHLNVRHFSKLSIGKKIVKIDADAHRNGRITLREVEDVLEKLAKTKYTSIPHWVRVIEWCGDLLSEELPEKRIQLVHDIWNTLEKREKNLCISCYNALLKVYLENEHAFLPTDILAELDEKSIWPDDITYQRLIRYYCLKGDIKGATHILQLMRERGDPIDEAVYNLLVFGHSLTNDMASAEGILNVMRQDGVDPTGQTYGILIYAYIEQGDINKVRSLLEECKTNHINLVYEDYFKIMYYSSWKDLDIDEILSILGCNDAYHQEAIIFVYKLIKMGEAENVLKILKNMVRSTPREDELIDENRHLKTILYHEWGEDVAAFWRR